MKKKDILNLIRCYVENNDSGFRSEARHIADEFDKSGDSQLASYIMSLLSDTTVLVPQENQKPLQFLEEVPVVDSSLFLPEDITEELMGAIHAVEKNMGINKFLFEGDPGTGKTEAAKHFARILNSKLYMVDFSTIVDSKLGQTQKNLVQLFEEMNELARYGQYVVLFDEFDSIALDRVNSNDLREMGRAVSELLKLLDRSNSNSIIIATTNLYKYFDKAVLRRFDAVISFNRYSKLDIQTIGENLLSAYMSQMKVESKDIRLFRKILNLANPRPSPGILKNMIRTSIAFSNPESDLDYLRRFYKSVTGNRPNNLSLLQKQNFTIREIGILMNESKSSIDRKLKGDISHHA